VIQCSVSHCRASSPLPVSRCQACQTPLYYRFLLAVSDASLAVEPGSLVADRYWVWSAEIWLDTRPEEPVVPLELLPPFVVPYLRLSVLPLHVPRPHTVLSPEDGGVSATVLLLDAAPILSRTTDDQAIQPGLLPSLTAAWASGTALQQLNWLRQAAQIWPDLDREGVAATLLHLDTLRVDHALLRLARLMLTEDEPVSVTLVTLGERWRSLLPQARPEIQPYLKWVVQALEQDAITSANDLLAELDRGVRTLAADLSVSMDWVTYTDQGPERPRNEDACYPEGQLHQVQLVGQGKQEMPLLLVCDGIGGHEQGNIASRTAIQVLLDELQPLAEHADPSPATVEVQICQALAAANDAIADRNNDENRSARARMGTTVVLALVHAPYVSIAHLGDSRAYRISDRTCYQLTLDDDIASRETRLGYTLYSEALQIPNGGALVQALGISDSAQLYPTVQHLLIDDPMVLLLCSDGLSDYDRVEMLWRDYVSPLTLHQGDLSSTGQALIQQANQLNGHDNVTVGLLRFAPKPSTYSPLPARALHRSAPPEALKTMAPQEPQPVATAANPEPSSPVTPVAGSKAPYSRGMGLGAVTLGALAAAMGFWFYGWRQPQPQPTAMTAVIPSLSLLQDQTYSLEALYWAVADPVSVGGFWQTRQAAFGGRSAGLALSPTPPGTRDNLSDRSPASDLDESSSSDSIARVSSSQDVLVPTGSILEITSQPTVSDPLAWVEVQVCSIPSGESLSQRPQETTTAPVSEDTPELRRRLASPGQSGWVETRHLYRAATPVANLTVTQRGNCLP
jgi:serine/threonine protein phosphatase PrpC